MHYNVINACILFGGKPLTQLTIRGLGVELHNALKETARRHGLSMNRYVLSILREAAGMGNKDTSDIEFTDLDHLAGTWSQKTYEQFQEQLNLQRSIDESLWQ